MDFDYDRSVQPFTRTRRDMSDSTHWRERERERKRERERERARERERKSFTGSSEK